jgi:hypothetical protein
VYVGAGSEQIGEWIVHLNNRLAIFTSPHYLINNFSLCLVQFHIT